MATDQQNWGDDVRRRWTEEELDALGADPREGEVWWCDGRALALGDGGKLRPVLIVVAYGRQGGARVVPLTSRKPDGGAPVAVAHRGGTSWMATVEARTVSVSALTSPLGAWAGYAAWKRALPHPL